MVRTLTPAFNSVTLNALRSTVAGALLVGWVLITIVVLQLYQIATLKLFKTSTDVLLEHQIQIVH
jgi:hypothetical protein